MDSDRNKLKELLTMFGVGFVEEENDIVCKYGRAKIEGYLSFITIFRFTKEGSFIKMDLLEW